MICTSVVMSIMIILFEFCVYFGVRVYEAYLI